MGIRFVLPQLDREGELEWTQQGPRGRLMRAYTVGVTSAAVTEDQIAVATGIPQLGSAASLPTGPVFVSRIRPKQRRNTHLVWDVYVEFTPITFNPEQPTPTNPLERPPEIHWEEVQLTKVFDIDTQNKPVTNSAREKFDPPPDTDQTEDVLVITRNQPTFGRSLTKAYKNKVNSHTFWGEPQGVVRCTSMTATLQWENDVAFWRATYRFQFRDKGWNPRKLYDEGYYELVDDPNNPGQKMQRQILGADDLPVPAPVPLDGTGLRLVLPAANPAFVEYDEYEEVDFTPLDLE